LEYQINYFTFVFINQDQKCGIVTVTKYCYQNKELHKFDMRKEYKLIRILGLSGFAINK